MTTGDHRNTREIDFFISYSVADERWATWIAWQLHQAGFRTLIQAWHFGPGVDWVQAMDRGIRESKAVLALLSANYLASPNCEREWQATLATDPGKLITIRIADTPLKGLLAAITYLDLVGADEERARQLLLERLRHLPSALPPAPVAAPHFPTGTTVELPASSPLRPATVDGAGPARMPAAAPHFPPGGEAEAAAREVLSVLHVPGPRFGRGVVAHGEPLDATGWRDRVWANVNELVDAGAPPPDLVVVTGDLAESGRPSEFAKGLSFLSGLRALLALEADRVIVVPGRHDVSKAACQAYFADCEAREIEPREPYHRKLEHFEWLFRQLYGERDAPTFDATRPWALFPVPALKVVVAGLNSTWAITHRDDDDHGLLGEAQIAWFSEQLREYERRGWLRIGALRHDPAPGSSAEPGDPRVLADAETLVRRLGGRLNMVLHGPGPGGLEVERLGEDLLVVPGIRAGHEELLAVTAEGLTRWAIHRPEARRAITVPQRWRDSRASFADERPVPAVREDADELDEGLHPAADPTSLLLERIAEVCRVRHEPVKIRRVPGADVAHLLVTRMETGFQPQWRIAGFVGEPTPEVVRDFAAHLHTGSGEAEADLVYQAPRRAPESLRDMASQYGIRLRSFTEFQGLPDLREYVTRQTVRLREDPRYPPDLYVPQRYREPLRTNGRVRDGLIEELIGQVTADSGRFVLLLGDFGRGKTYALREVARRLGETRNDLLPIFIELRGLDKAHSVEGLLAAHLANHREKHIDLTGLRYLLREGRIVLLFDGFDELVTRVTYDRATEHLDTLVQAFEGRAKIVVASRTQYFRSQRQVLTALGERFGVLPYTRVLTIEPFTERQIRDYLTRRYHGDEARAEERFALMRGVEDLVGLAANPRMLSFIAELETGRLRAVGESGEALTAAELYREILDSWLSYEAERIGGVAGSSGGLDVPDLWHAVTTLAVRLSDSGEAHLRVAELEEVAGALTDLAEGRLSPAQAAHAVGGGSLLIRTDDGLFGFIHASVTEWLVANAISAEFSRAGRADPARLGMRELSQLTIDFLCDLAEPERLHEWTRRVLDDPLSGDVVRANALKVSARLRTPPSTHLAGANLAGQDLSFRKWAGVDLTGADLMEARLVAADLSGARMSGARLIGARLERASLAGTDLSGADLTDAHLAGADLTGTNVDGVNWQRAALLDTRATPEILAAAQAGGAAVARTMPVHTEFAPAEIGVPFGFHAERGRLPRPLDYAPDGRSLAIGNKDGSTLLVHPRTGRMLRTLTGHHGRVFSVLYARDSSVLSTGAADGTIRLWDPLTGDRMTVLRGHAQWPWPMEYAPDSALLFAGDAEGVMRLWDIATGEEKHRWTSPHGLVYTVDFHPDGRTFATGHADGSVRLWHTHDVSAAAEPVATTGESVYRLSFSPDGRHLAVGGPGGDVRLLDARTLAEAGRLSSEANAVYTLAWHPTEPLLATGDTSGVVRIWDTARMTPEHVLSGHRTVLYWVAFSPAGETLVTGDAYGRMRVWDTATGALRHLLTGHTGSVWPFRFHPYRPEIAAADDQFTVRLWDTDTGRPKYVLRGHGRRVGWVRYSADGSALASGGNDGVIHLWDPRAGRLTRRLTGTEDRLVVLENAAFSPVRHRLATTSNDGRVNLLNLDSGNYERYVDAETPAIWAVEFSPNGDWIATANDDDTVRLWHRPTGRPGPVLAQHRGRVRSIVYHPSGALLATGCDDGMVRLWHTETGDLLDTLSGHTDRVYSVVFHPGGDLLASVSWDGTAQLWNRGGRRITTLTGHHDRLWTAAFHPTRDILATAGDDAHIRLWDPTDGTLTATLRGHRRRVWSVAFSPRGDQLASGGDDGTLRLWRLAPEPEGQLTLIGTPDGWAAIAVDGRYKASGEVAGQFWHTIGLRRFEPGELDPYDVGTRPLDEDAEF
ncbi:hypothetical protein Afil01_55600 [Actinorhabdospora filicis]|uniref:TIR domain-containing protein n=1 Tax=Actinorhabdospora filicis TaxID=1785913 RepID=A0A9W6WC63_9ACTN|nr:TIR domain-containing protein [Actinorhabdospora filicis]GLZ80753.1 hypothetical protein Afil01_55600 [Actinorhabdospora filicis]